MFKSKAEFAKALMEGRRFQYKDSIIFYNETNMVPFRCKHVEKSDDYSERLISYWESYDKKNLQEITASKTKVVHEWVVKDKDSTEWVLLNRLLTEDEIKKEISDGDTYLKTDRSFEVPV